MAQFPSLPLWTDAYLADTKHLTTIEHGTYLLLIIAMWRNKASLPDDNKFLARTAGLTPGQWARIAPTIRVFFRSENGVLSQDRLTDEYNYVKRNSKVQSDRARARWPKTNECNHADALPDVCEKDAPTPTPTPTSKKEEDARERETDFLIRIREAVGIDPADVPRFWTGPGAEEHIERWRGFGLSEEEVIAEAKASRCKNPEPPDGPKALDRWMEQARKAKASASAPAPTRKAQAAPKASTDLQDRLNFYAEWVKSERFMAANTISNTLRDALLTSKLVTVEDLRKRGIR